jgi:hypothetical protein
MAYSFAADVILAFHFLFILWMALGGFAVLWRPRLAFLHVPAVAWGLWIELSHGTCPLTPLENRLRLAGGDAGYPGGFIEHYVAPLIYPKGLNASHQLWIAALLAALSVVLYFWAWRRHRRR